MRPRRPSSAASATSAKRTKLTTPTTFPRSSSKDRQAVPRGKGLPFPFFFWRQDNQREKSFLPGSPCCDCGSGKDTRVSPCKLVLDGILVPHLGCALFLLQPVGGVQDYFNAVGETQLLEDSKYVVLYSIVAQMQPGGDFPIPQTLGEQPHHLFLTRRQHGRNLFPGNYFLPMHIGHSLDNVIHVLRLNPDMALNDLADTSLQHFDVALSADKHSFCPRTECVHHNFQLAAETLKADE